MHYCKECGHEIKQTIPPIKGVKDLRGHIAPDVIVDTILQHFEIEQLDHIIPFSRKRPLPYLRFVLMTFLKAKTKMSDGDVAEIFHRDRTTIMHGVQQIDNLMFSDPIVLEEIKEINKKLTVNEHPFNSD